MIIQDVAVICLVGILFGLIFFLLLDKVKSACYDDIVELTPEDSTVRVFQFEIEDGNPDMYNLSARGLPRVGSRHPLLHNYTAIESTVFHLTGQTW